VPIDETQIASRLAIRLGATDRLCETLLTGHRQMIADQPDNLGAVTSPSTFRGAVVLAVLAAVNTLIAAGYQWLPLVVVGPGAATDALFASLIPPQLFLAVVSGGLTSVLTPLLAIQNRAEFSRVAWTFLQVSAALAFVLNALLFVTAPVWVGWVVPGFTAPQRDLTATLLRIQLVGSIFLLPLSVGWSAYYARHRFVWADASAALAGLVGLAIMLPLILRYGVIGVAYATVVRSILQLALLIPGLGAYSRPVLATSETRLVCRRLLPLVMGSLYYKADPLIERMLASFAPQGQLSLLHLAQQLYIAGNQIITKALVNPLVPQLAQLSAAHRWDAFRRKLQRRTGRIIVLTVACTIVFVIVGRPLLRVLLVHGRFTNDSAHYMYWLLIALTGTWIAGAVGQMLTVGFFAYGNTSTPTRVGVFGFSVGIVLKIAAFKAWGVMGLALAGSVYYILTSCLHTVFLARDLRRVQVFKTMNADIAAKG
jgi:putative peptidoglycan lipid II flippase